MEEHVQFYLENGITPIPVFPQTKQPCVQWRDYQDFKPTEDELKQWFRTVWNPQTWKYNSYWKSRWIKARRQALQNEGLTPEEINSDPNLLEYDGSLSVAVLGGKTSNNLAFLDDDKGVLNKEELEFFKNKTIVTKTKNGHHIWTQTHNPIKTRDGKNGELRGEGGYVIAPPSIHVLGHKYTIVSNTKEISKNDSEEKDREFLEWASEKLEFDIKKEETSDVEPLDIEVDGLYNWHKKFLKTHFINDHLNALSLKLFAPSMVKAKVPKEKAAEIIFEWAKRCHEEKGAPLTVDKPKIERMYESAKENNITPLSQKGLQKKYPELYNELVAEGIIGYTRNSSVLMGQTLNYLNQKFIFCVPTDTEEILGYDEGEYRPFECVLKKELETLFGEELKREFVNETLAHVQRANYVERSEINKFGDKIPIQNGLFNLATHNIEPFPPKEIFTYKLNVVYDPTKKSEKWIKFVEEILPDKKDREFLQEVMGYCLFPAMPLHKLFWFYGSGRNGKDRVILTLEFILGPENTSHLNLGEFKENRRFSLCQLYGKLLNVSSEPESKYPISTNILKAVSGENTIHAELKGRNKRLKFTNKAKPIIVGNSFPKVTDTSKGFWERVETLKFTKSFIGKNCIPNIEKTWLNNPAEVSGIFNWMLEGLKRLRENKQFTSSKTTKETKAEFMRVSDPFNAWLMDCCKIFPNAYLNRGEAYNSYKDYAFELGATPTSARIFYDNMRRTPRIKDTQIKIEKKPVRVFQGVALKTEQEMENDQKTLDETPPKKKKPSKKKKVAKVAEVTGSTNRGESPPAVVSNNLNQNTKLATSATSATQKEPFGVDKIFPSTCNLCRRALPLDQAYCTILDGKPVHEACFRRLKAQEKVSGGP